MFTGIIRQLGKVRAWDGAVLEVGCNFEDVVLGDSIAINGVCLTVFKLLDGGAAFEVSAETVARTNFGELKVGAVVNLEQALRFDQRLDGNLVQGHVDDVVELREIERGENLLFHFSCPAHLRKFVAEKGAVTLNGVALTVTAVEKEGFAVMVIPYTFAQTNLQFLEKGAKVNLEVDLIARYLINFHENR